MHVAVIVDKEKCIGNAKCIEVCPMEAIELDDGKAIISDDCTECGTCIDECPNGALSLP
jgi:NAD-dependent dihydropyrimidine dehydrogenase PreA subunit